jgi:outer membrane usher protein
MPYQLDTIQVDPKGLPLNVQLDATSAQVAPYAGAVVMVDFKSKQGRALIVRIQMPDGKPAPFGAEVVDTSGQSLGVIGQAGLALLRGVSDSGRLRVQWQDAEGMADACGFAYTLPDDDKGASTYRQIQVTCTAGGTVPLSAGEKGE